MDFTNYEYAVSRKREGKLKIMTYALIAAYIAFVGAAFGILYAIRLIPVVAVVPVVLLIIVLLTWRYVQIDNKYVMDSGKMTFVRLYGMRTAKNITEFRIKDASVIAPLEKSAENIAEFSPVKTYDALPSDLCNDAYVALYINESGERCALKFQATAQALKVLRYYNEKTVLSQTSC